METGHCFDELSTATSGLCSVTPLFLCRGLFNHPLSLSASLYFSFSYCSLSLSGSALKRIAQDGLALRCAAEELRGDREVVMTAVTKNGRALEYATEEIVKWS